MVDLIIIYDRPADFPDSAVARRWVMDTTVNMFVPTSAVWTRGSLDELRDLLSLVLADRVRIPRSPGDDPCIVETWV